MRFPAIAAEMVERMEDTMPDLAALLFELSVDIGAWRAARPCIVTFLDLLDRISGAFVFVSLVWLLDDGSCKTFAVWAASIV